MKFPTVDKFFFCLPLEIGAFVLGGLSITASIGMVFIASTLLTRYVRFYNSLNETDQDFFQTVLITSVIVYTIFVLYFTIVVVASIMLILGTRRHDHNQLLLFLIMMGVGVLVSFIQIFQLSFFFLIPSVLSAVCSIYFFCCVYSLYQSFKFEKARHLPNDYDNVPL